MIQSKTAAAVPWWQREKFKSLIITVLTALVAYLGGEKVGRIGQPITATPVPKIATEGPQQPVSAPAVRSDRTAADLFSITAEPAAAATRPLKRSAPTKITLPPVARIVGPSGGKPGNLLILDAGSSIGAHYAWEVYPPAADGSLSYFAFEGGKKCCITGVPGVYQVFLAVSNDQGIDMTRWTLTVQSGGPQPDPGPSPGPGPQPDPEPDPGPQPDPEPDFKSEVSRQAYEAIKKIDFKPEELSLLIATLQTLANSAEKNSWSAKQILQEYQKSVGDIFSGVPDAASRWSTYNEWHQQQLFSVRDDPAGLILRMREIATGLEAAQ